MNESSALVAKLWNYCHVLRDDGLSYGDYVEQLTYLLFLKMANGAVYGIVPFINEKRIGLISGVVGAGGNLGGMIFGFLFRSPDIRYAEAFSAIGITVVGVAVFVSCMRWAPGENRVIVAEMEPTVEPAAAAASA